MTEIIKTVPLSKLVASTHGTRRTGALDAIEELAASIVAHGLLQSLVVAERDDGRFVVVAGLRRLAALKLLAKARTISRQHPVPVVVVAADVQEFSLAENVMRVALHPADQFEAFSRLARSGASAVEIAARFGWPERVVRQHLALGAVSPRLVALYRTGDVTLDQLQAFAVTNDHARQEEVWD